MEISNKHDCLRCERVSKELYRIYQILTNETGTLDHQQKLIQVENILIDNCGFSALKEL